VSGYLAIRFLIGFVARRRLTVFVPYVLALAALLAVAALVRA